jgi:hypothetical protein
MRFSVRTMSEPRGKDDLAHALNHLSEGQPDAAPAPEAHDAKPAEGLEGATGGEHWPEDPAGQTAHGSQGDPLERFVGAEAEEEGDLEVPVARSSAPVARPPVKPGFEMKLVIIPLFGLVGLALLFFGGKGLIMGPPREGQGGGMFSALCVIALLIAGALLGGAWLMWKQLEKDRARRAALAASQSKKK